MTVHGLSGVPESAENQEDLCVTCPLTLLSCCHGLYRR